VALPVSAFARRYARRARAALVEHAPGDEHRFESELRDALGRAADDLDLAGPEAVLTRWHALATMAANPLTADERAQGGALTRRYTTDCGS
jgi:Family of unknown function (DUF6247)